MLFSDDDKSEEEVEEEEEEDEVEPESTTKDNVTKWVVCSGRRSYLS